MILDEPERFNELDPMDMLGYVNRLPEQLQAAWELGNEYPLPDIEEVEQVILAGMGGSAIGGDLLASYAMHGAKVPIVVWRNYDLPGFASDSRTLLIASSHSGNTEETLSAFDAALERGTKVMAVTTGGTLAETAVTAGAPVWRFEHDGQPRSAVGFSFGMLLSALVRMGFIDFRLEDLDETVAAMHSQMSTIGAEVPVARNLAKRMAGQFMDRWPTIIAADFLSPVARRWRTQLAEIPKAVAQFEELPEADHNMVEGVQHPESLFGPTMVVFLRSTLNHPRNLKRLEITRSIMMVEGFNTDIMEAQGQSRLAHQWTSLHLGDYVAYYLAMAYGTDPTPVPIMQDLKQRLTQD
ncbi:MAG: bifunctional phosphoglucose/phosphomannose isomerase [Anaerolineales bacterium]